ncbi:MAG: DUF58 domain-containing protein [Candidatus Methylomirabilota bacterium]
MDEPLDPFSSLFTVPLILCLVGGLLFAALLYRQRELILLCLLVLAVGGGAKLWAGRSAAGFTGRLAADRQRLFPGERLTLGLEAENRRWLPVLLRARIPVGGLGGPPSKPLAATRGLLWHQQTSIRWELAAGPRGVHRLGPARLSTGDLFGFYSTAHAVDAPLSVVVYPRLVPLRRFAPPRREFFGLPGAESPVRDPVYLLGTQEYQHGRPAKHIHWKASARHHRLQEKVFEPTQQAKVLLVVEAEGFAGTEAAPEFERALEAVASLAARLNREGAAVGLLASGAVEGGGAPFVPLGGGPHQLPAILELLARLSAAPGSDLQETLRAGLRLPWGVSCLCVARSWRGSASAFLRHLADRRVPALLFVSRPVRGEGAEGEAPANVRPLASILAREDEP